MHLHSSSEGGSFRLVPYTCRVVAPLAETEPEPPRTGSFVIVAGMLPGVRDCDKAKVWYDLPCFSSLSHELLLLLLRQVCTRRIKMRRRPTSGIISGHHPPINVSWLQLSSVA